MIRERLDRGVIEPCSGPYRNNWFLVAKGGSKYRLINDAQTFNAFTARDAGVPPNVEEFAEEFAGMQVGSLVDLFSGYDQIELDQGSRDLTGFMTGLGLMRMTTLPQGATNSVV